MPCARMVEVVSYPGLKRSAITRTVTGSKNDRKRSYDTHSRTQRWYGLWGCLYEIKHYMPGTFTHKPVMLIYTSSVADLFHCVVLRPFQYVSASPAAVRKTRREVDHNGAWRCSFVQIIDSEGYGSLLLKKTSERIYGVVNRGKRASVHSVCSTCLYYLQDHLSPNNRSLATHSGTSVEQTGVNK
jgi:hypothetical protein